MSTSRRWIAARWAKRPTFAGDGLIERLRTTTFAVLGLTAIGGMVTIGLLASAGYPNLPPGPPPTGPLQGISSARSLGGGEATALAGVGVGGSGGGPGGNAAAAAGTVAGTTATTPSLFTSATLPDTTAGSSPRRSA